MDYSAEQILFLNYLPGIGTSKFWQIVNQYPNFETLKTCESIVFKLPESARGEFLAYQKLGEGCATMSKVHQELEKVERSDASLIVYSDEDFPPLLKEISCCPPALYVRGDKSLLNFPQVAIVGSRNPSAVGRQTAENFSADLAASGFSITSGLALGIDTAAHKGALKAEGKTLAVIGTGIDKVYPARNARLFDKIIESGGALVTEFPMGTAALAHNFPRRNRTISGLSCGTLVVEAALKSGSLITARYALEQNREVFAIPGSIHSPLSRGCNSLIKSGAKLVERTQDVVDELSNMIALQWENLELTGQNSNAAKTNLPQNDLTAVEAKIYEQIGFDYICSDEIVNRVDLPIGEVMAQLMSLELKGRIALEAPGYIRTVDA